MAAVKHAPADDTVLNGESTAGAPNIEVVIPGILDRTMIYKNIMRPSAGFLIVDQATVDQKRSGTVESTIHVFALAKTQISDDDIMGIYNRKFIARDTGAQAVRDPRIVGSI